MSIQVDHISYTYMTHTSLEKKALDDVAFTLEKGEFVALIGHTGSGKSTLAEHLNGLLQDAGSQSRPEPGGHGIPVSGTPAVCGNHL